MRVSPRVADTVCVASLNKTEAPSASKTPRNGTRTRPACCTGKTLPKLIGSPLSVTRIGALASICAVAGRMNCGAKVDEATRSAAIFQRLRAQKGRAIERRGCILNLLEMVWQEDVRDLVPSVAQTDRDTQGETNIWRFCPDSPRRRTSVSRCSFTKYHSLCRYGAHLAEDDRFACHRTRIRVLDLENSTSTTEFAVFNSAQPTFESPRRWILCRCEPRLQSLALMASRVNGKTRVRFAIEYSIEDRANRTAVFSFKRARRLL